MKFQLFLRASGLEKIAKQDPTFYPWDFTIALEGGDAPPANCIFVAEGKCVFPEKGVAVQAAVAAYNADIQEIRANALADENEKRRKINDLLMISFDSKEESAVSLQEIGETDIGKANMASWENLGG
jgi:hypothetical protein